MHLTSLYLINYMDDPLYNSITYLGYLIRFLEKYLQITSKFRIFVAIIKPTWI